MSEGLLRHEALDRLDIINRMIDELLCKHQYVATHSKILLQVKKAQRYLSEAYQHVGRDDKPR